MKRAVLFSIIFIMCSSMHSAAQAIHYQPEINSNTNNTANKTRTIALKHCTLIDGINAQPINDVQIIIEDDKIKNIIKDDSVSLPENCISYDLNGYTVLPGFINAHVHMAYNESSLQNWSKAGVLTVRDLGPRISDFIEQRDKLNKNQRNARIVSSTPILTVQGGYGRYNYSSPEDAVNVVDKYIDQKVDIVKFSIENRLQGRDWKMPTYDEVKAIVDTAHGKGKKVSVHLTHTQNLQWAIDAGVDDISHMVVEPLEQKYIDEMITKNIYWIPTLELWNGVSSMNSIEWVNVAIDNLSKIYHSGGKIALGTDFSGYNVNFDRGFPITEVSLMKKAGMSNMDIIIAATRNASYVCGLEKDTGTLEIGKKADLFVVYGNPLEDIEVFKNVKMVIHDGNVIYE